MHELEQKNEKKEILSSKEAGAAADEVNMRRWKD